MTAQPDPPVLTDAHRQQVTGWRRLFVLMAAVSVASLALNAFQWRSTTGDADSRSALEDCRAEVAAGVTVASVDRDIADAALNRADAALTLAIGAEVGVDVPPGTDVLTLAQALAEVERTGRLLDSAERALVAARDNRAAFEAAPTEDC